MNTHYIKDRRTKVCYVILAENGYKLVFPVSLTKVKAYCHHVGHRKVFDLPKYYTV